MGNNKQFAFPILIMLLLVILIVSFRFFLLANVVRPVALLLWALWRVISSVDQQIYWMGLIILCSILVLRLFPSDNNSTESAYRNRDKSLGRVEHWQTLIKDSTLGNNESKRLHDSLKDLLSTVVAEDEQSEPTKLENGITKGKSRLPFTSQTLLFPQNKTQKNLSIGLPPNPIFLLPRWLRSWASRFVRHDYTLIDETLRWMETELEINDEN